VLILAAFACSPVTVHAQTPATPNPAPIVATGSSTAQTGNEDLGQLLAKAAAVNGLDGPNVKPWHLKASFETFDDDGKSKSTGTYEEWWAGEKKRKSTFVVGGVSQTDYATDKGTLRTGSRDWFESAVTRVPGDLLKPMAALLANYAFDEEDKALGPVKVRCVTLRRLWEDTISPSGTPGIYYLDAERPTLRVKTSSDGTYKSFYNHIVQFQDGYLAKDIDVLHNGKPQVKIHLESVENLVAIEDGDFTPPADAVRPAPRQVNISGAVAAGHLIRKVAPNYPEAMREIRLTGVVVLQAAITKDGHVRDLEVISGPKGLQQAAMDAVQQWEYKPYLLNGEPVEVMTTINVVFTLNR
jgi:TonB family protein